MVNPEHRGKGAIKRWVKKGGERRKDRGRGKMEESKGFPKPRWDKPNVTRRPRFKVTTFLGLYLDLERRTIKKLKQT